MIRRYYEDIINYLLKGTFWKGATDAERNVILKRSTKYKVINGVLYHKGKGRGIEDLRLVATSKADQQNAIRMCHVSEVDDQHFGFNKTASLLASRFYWRMMYTDVNKYIETCPKCQAARGIEPPVQTNVVPEEKPWVWRMLEVQVLEKFHVNGKKLYHLLRLVDVHSNWTTFSFLEDSSERTAIRTLFRDCCLLGFPQAFRFVNCGDDRTWRERFVSALHQELDGFVSACGQEVDTSIHVVMEEKVPDWQPEQCLQNCQQMIMTEPAALYVFFGDHSLVEQNVHDWYVDQVQQFVKKEPFWWPHRLPAFMFHLRNSLPPGMTSSPASMLASGIKNDSHLFLPIGPEEEAEVKVEPLVAFPAPKELLAESCFRTGKQPAQPVKKMVEAVTQTRISHKDPMEIPVSESQPSKRKPEMSKPSLSSSSSSGNKRFHHSSKLSSRSGRGRTKEEQQKIDESIEEALEIVISKGMKDVKSLEPVKKRKKKKHSKKNNEHSNTSDMFGVSVPMVLAPRHSPALDMAMSSGMSSLEALKAVTGTALPQSVPPSPLLSSVMLSPTTPEENSPAPPQEEASPGRYSFRQNLKPKGTSNFIRRLIAKTSSKRYTRVQIPESSEWIPSPPKKTRRRHPKLLSSHTPSPVIPNTPLTATSSVKSVQSSTPLSSVKDLEQLSPIVQGSEKDQVQNSFSPSSLTLELSATSTESNSSLNHLKRADSTLDEDFESNCNLRLTRAEEELIDQTIKGVDENGFMDADRMVGDAVLAVEDMSKDDLSGMEVSDSDATNVLSTNTVNEPKTNNNGMLSKNIVNNLYTVMTKGVPPALPNGDVLGELRISEDSIQRVSSDVDDSVLKGCVLSTEQDDLVAMEQDRTADKLGISAFIVSSSSSENQTIVEDAGCDIVKETMPSMIALETTECSGDFVSQESSTENNAVDFVETESMEVCTTDVNSDIIFDVLDTCATFEVGEKKALDEELSDNVEDNELERLKEKISQDLASGLTTDKIKSAKALHCVDTDNADTDEHSIMASACHALLHMASATALPVSVNSEMTCSSETKPECASETEPSDVNKMEVTVPDESPLTCSVETDATQAVELAVTESVQTQNEEETLPVPAEDEKMVEDDAGSTNAMEDESELCLPSDFFLDEEVLAEIPASETAVEEKKVEKPHVQSKVGADQDIVTILNSIMNNRAFLDDPVARLQREKEDRYLKELHGIQKEIKIKIRAISDLVVQRAILGPVPVRTIRNNDRRAYYVGNIKIDEFKTSSLGLVNSTGLSIVRPPSLVVKRARVHLPKITQGQPMKILPPLVKTIPPKETVKTDSGGSGRSTPSDMQSILKKGRKPFGCPICPRTYVISQEMLDLHVAFHIDNARNLHCPVCGKAGTVWTNILKHYLGHSEIKDNASLYEMILATCDKDRRLCGQCNTLFAMRNALIHHLQSSHVGEKVNGSVKVRVPEPLIPKEPFPEPAAQPTAVPEVKEVNYLCPNCPYSTKTHYNLILHGHECQGSVQKFGDAFTKALDDLTPQFKCKLCGYCGVSSKQLEQHMRLRHSSATSAMPTRPASKPQECKFSCEFCPHKFKTSDLLRCHLMKHKEASMFHCKACSYTCRYKKIMHRHVHKVHPNMSLKSLIQAPKKMKGMTNIIPGQAVKVQKGSDEDLKDSELENEDNEDEGIPTATVVVHTDENGELTVCDEDDVSEIPLQSEQTTFLLDSGALDTNTVTLDGSAVTLDGSAVTLDGSVTLDGNVLQLLQSDTGDCNGQPKVLFLSVGPSELESLSSSTFTIAEHNISS